MYVSCLSSNEYRKLKDLMKKKNPQGSCSMSLLFEESAADPRIACTWTVVIARSRHWPACLWIMSTFGSIFARYGLCWPCEIRPESTNQAFEVRIFFLYVCVMGLCLINRSKMYYCVKAKKFRLSSHTSKSSGPKHSSQKCSMACNKCAFDPSKVCPSSGYV